MHLIRGVPVTAPEVTQTPDGPAYHGAHEAIGRLRVKTVATPIAEPVTFGHRRHPIARLVDGDVAPVAEKNDVVVRGLVVGAHVTSPLPVLLFIVGSRHVLHGEWGEIV